MRHLFISLLIIGVFLFSGLAVNAATLQDAFEWWRTQSKTEQKIRELEEEIVEEIPVPVLFIALDDIVSDFGTPRRTRLHEGQDIMAPKNTPIVSPTEAVVIHTAYGVGEGNAVYTANPGNETFVYYHLDRIGEGVTVGKVLKRGDLVGYVGDTGDAKGGADHLHFEIRNSSASPIDPYLRFKKEFSLKETISFLSDILDGADNSVALAKILVVNFRSVFALATSENIQLPGTIANAMDAGSGNTSSTGNEELSNDLSVGSLGSSVLLLQNFLIQADAGSAARELKDHGSTGYFGPLTRAALAEYQQKMEIDSPLGYYDKNTRIFIQNHLIKLASSDDSSKTASDAVNPPNPPNNSDDDADVSNSSDDAVLARADIPLVINRNLYQGIGGEDVRNLQKFLNKEGYIVSSAGNGSPGNEIPYFGPGTRAAVIKFQIANNISPAVGFVGPITRNFLASLKKSS